jgi:hypothetical protein
LGAVAWLLLLGVVVRGALVRLSNADLWWHLAAGRAMAQTHTLLRTDIFSHTMAGAPWINFEWLSQLIFYGLVSVGGFWALYLAKVVLCLLVVALLGLLAARVGARDVALFLLVWVGFNVVQPRLQDRPELLSLFLMGVLMHLVLWARSAATSPRQLSIVVFLLMTVWTNLHGGFVYGLGALALLTLGAAWEGRKDVALLLAWATAAGVAGALINPYGVKIFAVFLEHARQMSGGPLLLQEWRTPTVADVPYFWVMYLAMAAALVMGFVQRAPLARFWAPAVVVFAVWGTVFYRNAALVPFVALPFLAQSVKNVRAPWPVWLLALGLLAPAVPRVVEALPHGPVAWHRVPEKTCAFVREKNIRGVMFNTYNVGGYLTWALGPDRLVFMDGRYLFYPLLSNGGPWQPAYLASSAADYAIVDYPPVMGGVSPVNILFPSNKWALVFWDDAGLLFLKRTPAFNALIAEREYRALKPYNLEQMAFELGRGTVLATDVYNELNRHAVEAGLSYRGQEIVNLLEQTTSRRE